MNTRDAIYDLTTYADAERAVHAQRFFKTGKGQYGEGDVFIGVTVPNTRKVAKQYKDLPLDEVQSLLDSDVHEKRLLGLLILTYKYPKATLQEQRLIYEFYLQNVYGGNVNNWDLVDASTPNIIGEYLADKPKDILYSLARSDNLWQKRVSILATFAFIKRGEPGDTLAIAELLLHDTHDLIHKAVGWMLREAGKRVDEKILTDFLDNHAHEMPRTMLRYAIERLSPVQKQHYMTTK